MKKITIIGAGLAGTLMAIYLAKRGYHVELYERRTDLRKHKREEGRSINLAISTRGIQALKEVGLDQKILDKSVPMWARMIHKKNGDIIQQSYSITKKNYLNSISRKQLNVELLNATTEFSNITIHFQTDLVDIDIPNQILICKINNQAQKIYFEHLLAADGAASAVRDILYRQRYIDCQRNYLDHGYKELTISHEKGKVLSKNYLHIWPRKAFMLIALPNLDSSFTCTLFLPYRGEKSFEVLHNENDIKLFFKNEFPDALTLMPSVGKEYFEHPKGHLNTVTADTWNVGDKILLIGDSAHAILPFYGQGMNCAFEDCSIINKLLNKHNDNWSKVIKEFCQARKKDTDAIAKMSQQNYLEMRNSVAEKTFQLKKQIEAELMRRYPKIYKSQYSLVTFSQVSYSYALKCGQLQQQLLDKMITQFKTMQAINWDEVDKLIDWYQSQL